MMFWILAAAATAAGLLLAVKLGAAIALGTVIGVVCALVLSAILGKSKLIGALTGLGTGLLTVAIFWHTMTGDVRCQFGDPVDLPPLTHPAGYIYVIQDTEFSRRYKIGRTNNPERRLNEIRNILPGRSEIVAIVDTQDAPALEWQLHERYADGRKRGEWFDLSDSQVREICQI